MSERTVGTGALTMPEALALLLFQPRHGSFAGEGLPLMVALGGAALVELAASGHAQLEPGASLLGPRARPVVGPPPEDPLLRSAWQRMPATPTGLRTLVVRIGPSLREAAVERLVERGVIERRRRRLLGLIPTTSLHDAGTGERERLLGPVRAALLDGHAADAHTAALAGLLSASDALPALHADIPWSSAVHRHGKAFERGDRGANAASQAVLAAALVQVASGLAAGTAAAIAAER